LLLGAVLLLPAMTACGGAYSPVEIKPASAADSARFTGAGRDIEIEFINDSGGADVEVFPEPPLTIRSKSAAKSCQADGGIWVRKSAYLSDDERILMLQEYSGSNDALVFYDTHSCLRRFSLDISGARWQFENGGLVLGRECVTELASSCKQITRYEFDGSNLPKRK
jgi:hypothetical protein